MTSQNIMINNNPLKSYKKYDYYYKNEKVDCNIATLLLYLEYKKIGRKQFLENDDKNALIWATETGGGGEEGREMKTTKDKNVKEKDRKNKIETLIQNNKNRKKE